MNFHGGLPVNSSSSRQHSIVVLTPARAGLKFGFQNYGERNGFSLVSMFALRRRTFLHTGTVMSWVRSQPSHFAW